MKLCVVFLWVLLEIVASYFCYWNSGCPYKYFSDKTPYNNVRGDIRDTVVKLKGMFSFTWQTNLYYVKSAILFTISQLSSKWLFWYHK